MHIKTITIQGFKTYRDQVQLEPPFSPGHNVIIGRNGSGKSNFFMDAYTSLSREERQRLLHEGTSTSTTLSAYVEIVFDNTDGRFPTGHPEVFLRRTIGLKKDEYSLDKKSVTKAEVMNLLESAGFSRSNPYYIVPQGRITHLTNMSEKERLNLLKDVAGTQVYEQKRSESTRIMEDTEAKREKIVELLTNIEERLDELEAEKEELKEYQQQDKEKRCLEYAVYKYSADELEQALAEVHASKDANSNINNEKRNAFNDLERRALKLEDELQTAKHARTTQEISRQQLEADLADLMRARTEVECVISDYEQASENSETLQMETREKLSLLENRVAKATERLVELGAELELRTAEEREAKERLNETTSRLNALYGKQGRSKQFKSQKERDQFLNEDIKRLTSYEKTQEKVVSDLNLDVESARTNLDDVVERAAAQTNSEAEQRTRYKELGEEIAKLQTEHDNLMEKRKGLWRQDGKLGNSAASAKQELDDAERRLQGLTDRDTRLGLRSVKALKERLNLPGVYGAVYELFTVSDMYKQAVDAVAGGSLFHIIVDNDHTAKTLVDAMVKERSGRLTFIPLNRTKSINVRYPTDENAVPLVQKLQFDRTFKVAFDQIFGRTLVCSDLVVARQVAKAHGLNTVTLEGDKADSKGSMTGGYHDVRSSRLDTVRLVKRWRDTYEADAKLRDEVKDSLMKIEQQLTRLKGEIQKLERQRANIAQTREHQSKQTSWTQSEEDQARRRLARLEESLADATAHLQQAIAQAAGMREELTTPLTQQLSPTEVQEMEDLTKTEDEQKQALLTASQERQKIASEHSTLSIELTVGLRRRREELRAKLDDLEGATGSGVLHAGEIEQRKVELDGYNRSVEEIKGQLKNAEDEITRLDAEIAQKSAESEGINAQQLEQTRAMTRAQRELDGYAKKVAILTERKESCDIAIRDLGVLPEEAFTKYTSTKQDKIVKLLHKVNESLKKFAHVNKKAFEQYSNFTKQRDELLKRRDELDASAESIQDLIKTLDQRKDEAIQRTFKQVSGYFEEVFEQLVPAGRGQLIIRKRVDGYEDEETQELPKEVENYSGVAIQVSFNSKEDEGQFISQLSGGQKSLVALATVFAIQKCDPAPFYLFDEIDANLDTQYRKAVADMIYELSRSAQFITTTFRAEMLERADQYYGVYFDKQKVSTIEEVSKENAYKFLETAADAIR